MYKMQINWIDIKGYKGRYQINNSGEIMSLIRNKILTPRKCGQYNAVCLYDSNINRKNFYIHKLVAEYFIENPLNKDQVNHKDGNKNNNSIDNLEWCTASENINHAYRIGFKKAPCAHTGRFGFEHHRSKSVYQFNTNKDLIGIYGSICEASRETNIDRKSISNCANNKTKTSGGYYWEFNNDWGNV